MALKTEKVGAFPQWYGLGNIGNSWYRLRSAMEMVEIHLMGQALQAGMVRDYQLLARKNDIILLLSQLASVILKKSLSGRSRNSFLCKNAESTELYFQGVEEAIDLTFRGL